MLETLTKHFNFTGMPFRRDLEPAALHRYDDHQQACARITWTIADKALGVLTGEVGVGKTVAVRSAIAALDPTKHTIIYLANPAVGTRGICHHIVAGLGGKPHLHRAILIPQAAEALATEAAERARTPVVVIDEAHLLEHDQLESIRMLTLCRHRDYAGTCMNCPDPQSVHGQLCRHNFRRFP